MRISRNTFDYNKNRKGIVFQLGVPAVDNELTEGFDVALVEGVEAGHAAQTALYAAQPSQGPKPVYAFGDAWKPVSGGGVITLTAGTAYVDGYSLTLAANLDLSSPAGGSLDFTPDGALNIYGIIYADIVLTTVDSTADSTILTPNVGETTGRTVLSVTFKQIKTTVAGSLTSYDTLFAAIAALPAVTTGRLWGNVTARVVICRYRQAPASAPAAGDIIDLRQQPRGGLAGMLMEFGSFVAWNAATSNLQVSSALAQPIGGPVHNIARGQVATTPALVGAANADGVMAAYDGTNTYVIPDGSCVGWLAVGVAASNTTFSQLRTKGDNDATDASSVSAGSTTLTAHKLSVGTRATFAAYADVGSRFLCTRRGNDLFWANGAITRGSASRVVIDNPNRNAQAYDLVLTGQDNATIGGVAMNGVEAALNYLASAGGVGALGTARSITLRVRRGEWDFTRIIHTYGTTAEVSGVVESYTANANQLELIGDGSECTRIRFRNPEAAARAAGDASVCNLRAYRIRLAGITFDSVHDATFIIGRLLSLEAAEVVLEDCVFHGPVHIKARRVQISNCTFLAAQNASTNFAYASTGDPWVGQHLHLQTVSATAEHVWNVNDCRFEIRPDPGTQASVLIEDDEGDVVCRISNSKFRYYSSAAVPAVHVAGSVGQIELTHCRFIEAGGAGKVGITQANVNADVAGWLADTAYKTIPFRNDGSGRVIAHSYVSVTAGRTRDSRLSVNHCYFSMAQIGRDVSDNWIVWGCMMAVANYASAASAAAVRIANIDFSHNVCNMTTDEAQSTYESTMVLRTKNPALWGFYAGTVLPEGAGITNFVLENVSVEGNVFDIGGDDIAKSNLMWRSNTALDPMVWDATLPQQKLLSVQANLIKIDLNNRLDTPGGATFGGRSAAFVRIHGNQIRQRMLSGGTAWASGVETLDATLDYGPSWFVPISVCVIPKTNITTAYPARAITTSAFWNGVSAHDVSINGNLIRAVAYTGTNHVHGGPVSARHPLGAIFLCCVHRASVVGNNIIAGQTASAGSFYGLENINSQGTNVVGNQFLCPRAVASELTGDVVPPFSDSGSYAANSFDGCTTVFHNSTHYVMDLKEDATSGDNFKAV